MKPANKLVGSIAIMSGFAHSKNQKGPLADSIGASGGQSGAWPRTTMCLAEMKEAANRGGLLRSNAFDLRDLADRTFERE